jgi:glycosyltransferase involved in cell wall biosynthesis
MKSLSIVTPTFQSIDFLTKTLNSCVSQKAKTVTNIICDNLSTDGLSQTLFTQPFPNSIVLSSEEDHGPAQAINRGFRLAEGEIIGWINSDDCYASGAIDRALDLFELHPKVMMIYGAAEHVNLFGEALNAYPSLSPTTPIESFQNGSFICQPTVFFRRELLDDVGYLDENLKTAFDFDWFIRIFKYYSADRIGYVDQIQAYSRLHGQCLTKKYRQIVASESIQVIAKYFDYAPAHWLQTYFDELCTNLPYVDSEQSASILGFFSGLEKYIIPSEYASLLQRFADDIRSGWLAGPAFINTQADGWVKNEVLLKVQYQPSGPKKFSVLCAGEWPIDATLNFQILSWDGVMESISVSSLEEFVLEFELPEMDSKSYFTWLIKCEQSFIPAVLDGKSSDTRELSFRVLNLSWQTPD